MDCNCDKLDMDSNSNSYSYFIVKCGTLESLQKCIESGLWAFRARTNSPQPEDLLKQAHERNKSKVILIFSVNNQHGWHGYCESLFPDRATTTTTMTFESAKMEKTDELLTANDEWTYFPVKWISHFQSLSPYECLPFNKTTDLVLVDNVLPVNKARNWQELSSHSGKQMCCLIDQHYDEIVRKRKAEEIEKLEAIKARESFFKEEVDSVGFCEDLSSGWQSVINKVEKDLGSVVLACPFGSQRYNCSVEGSDSDILVVYQARTVALLGLDTPIQTIKIKEQADCIIGNKGTKYKDDGYNLVSTR